MVEHSPSAGYMNKEHRRTKRDESASLQRVVVYSRRELAERNQLEPFLLNGNGIRI